MRDAAAMVMLDRTIAVALRARDLMQADVLTVGEDTPLVDIHRVFVEEEIHGAPVVDDAGRVCGVVSTLDLARALRDDSESADAYASASCAADVMTRELVTVTPDTPIVEVARTMREQRIHRVLVVEDAALVGVITTFDLLRAFIPEPAVARVALH